MGQSARRSPGGRQEGNAVSFDLRTAFRGLAAAAIVALGFAGPAQAQDVNPLQLAVESPLGDVVLGAAKAPVTIIEYASMTCPHCAAFHNDVFGQLQAAYIDTGKVRFIIREFPLEAWAAAAFSLARCAEAATPGVYYTLIGDFFENQSVWTASVDAFVAFVQPYGFTPESFYACIEDETILAGIEWSYDRGVELGVNATPTFFINGRRQIGGISFEDLSRIIDGLLP
ncbi:MAG: DsbA family protein [Bauldia sp.]|nr:DsbA family protein [Bauldia sp.]